MNILPSRLHRDITELSLLFDELEHDRAEIMSILGHAEGESADYSRNMIDQVISESGVRCTIHGGYRFFGDIKRHDDKIHYRINDIEFAIGKTISSQLRKAESIVLFVCTIGAGLEEWAQRLMNEGDFFKAYIIDVVASQTVELAMEKIQDYLEQEQRAHGLRITNRYSPGYCGWHVSEQHKLFSLLPKNFCSISLTTSSLMLPIKSVSGIIGVGANVSRLDYSCRLCDMRDCVYRRQSRETMQDA